MDEEKAMTNDKDQRDGARGLLADYRVGRIERRDFLRMGALLGLSLPFLDTLPARAASGRAAKRGGMVTVAAVAPATIEPPLLIDGPGIAVVQQSCEYLVRVGPDLIPRPLLATGWRPSQGGRAWTVSLRRGVLFHDGREMTADDVVATFKRLIKPPSTALSAFRFLKAEGIRKVDRYTVAFNLESVQVDFPSYLASYQAVILPANWPGNFAKNPIGTGPFCLVEYVPQQRARFVRNPTYWQKGLPYLDGVEILLNLAPEAQATALLGGSADVLVTTQPNTLPVLRGGSNVKVLTAPSAGFNGLFVRTDTAPFNDVRVRQAMALCINRPAIVAAVDTGLSAVGDDSVISPIYPLYSPLPQRAQDYAAAKRLLAVAGHPNGFATTLTAASDASSSVALATVTQQMLKGAGIDVTIRTEPSSAYYNTDWLDQPFTLTGWAHRNTPGQYLDVAFRGGAAFNASHYKNPALDKLIDALDSTLDLASRKATAKRIETILYNDVPAILPTFGKTARAMRANLQGVVADPESYLDLSEAYLG